MSTLRTILRAFAFGVIAEVIAIGLSFGLFSFSYRREPMDDPFSWAAIVLQMPGAFISDWLVQTVANYTVWFRWTFIFCVQALFWSIISLAFLPRRNRRRRDISA
jgi:hypothetical protein